MSRAPLLPPLSASRRRAEDAKFPATHPWRVSLYPGRAVPALDSAKPGRTADRRQSPLHPGQRAIRLPEPVERGGLGGQTQRPSQARRTEIAGRQLRRRPHCPGAAAGAAAFHAASAGGIAGPRPAADSRGIPHVPGRRTATRRTTKCSWWGRPCASKSGNRPPGWPTWSGGCPSSAACSIGSRNSQHFYGLARRQVRRTVFPMPSTSKTAWKAVLLKRQQAAQPPCWDGDQLTQTAKRNFLRKRNHVRSGGGSLLIPARHSVGIASHQGWVFRRTKRHPLSSPGRTWTFLVGSTCT